MPQERGEDKNACVRVCPVPVDLANDKDEEFYDNIRCFKASVIPEGVARQTGSGIVMMSSESGKASSLLTKMGILYPEKTVKSAQTSLT
jgi:hypothetical protein